MVKINFKDLPEDIINKIEEIVFSDPYLEECCFSFISVGGFPLSLLRGGTPGDYDFAFFDSIDKSFIQKIYSDNPTLDIKESAWAFSVHTENKIFQFMKLYSGNPYEFFKSYDLNICKVAMFFSERYFLVHPDVIVWDTLRNSDWLLNSEYDNSLVIKNNFLEKTWAQRFFKYLFRYPELKICERSNASHAKYSYCITENEKDCELLFPIEVERSFTSIIEPPRAGFILLDELNEIEPLPVHLDVPPEPVFPFYFQPHLQTNNNLINPTGVYNSGGPT